MNPIKIVVAGEAAPFQKKVMSWTAKDGRFGTHAYDSKKYSGWKDQARYAAAQAMGERPPLEVAVEITIKTYRTIPTSFSQKKYNMAMDGIIRPTTTPDYDNIAKACSDSLIGIVIRDDKFIVTGHVEKWYSDRPRVEMTVFEYIPTLEMFR